MSDGEGEWERLSVVVLEVMGGFVEVRGVEGIWDWVFSMKSISAWMLTSKSSSEAIMISSSSVRGEVMAWDTVT